MLTVERAIVTPATYDDARWLMTGAVYRDHAVVPEALRLTAGAWRPVDPVTIPYDTAPVSRIQNGVYLGRFHTHFGHFLIETLPMLYWAAGKEEALVFHPWEYGLKAARERYIDYFLNALGIAFEHLLLVRDMTRIDRLRVPVQSRIFSGWTNIPLQALYGRVTRSLSPDPSSPRKIYFSRVRLGPQQRQVDSEGEMEQLFASMGFAIVYPETLPIAEQVRIVYNAKVVAGVDGSALHLCAFMRGGVCLVIKTRNVPAIQVVNDGVGVRTIWLDARAADLAVRIAHEVGGLVG